MPRLGREATHGVVSGKGALRQAVVTARLLLPLGTSKPLHGLLVGELLLVRLAHLRLRRLQQRPVRRVRRNPGELERRLQGNLVHAGLVRLAVGLGAQRVARGGLDVLLQGGGAALLAVELLLGAGELRLQRADVLVLVGDGGLGGGELALELLLCEFCEGEVGSVGVALEA